MTGDALRMAEEAALRAAHAAAYDKPVRNYIRRLERMALPRQRTETNLGEVDSSQRPPTSGGDGGDGGGGSGGGGGGGSQRVVKSLAWNEDLQQIVITYSSGPSPEHFSLVELDVCENGEPKKRLFLCGEPY